MITVEQLENYTKMYQQTSPNVPLDLIAEIKRLREQLHEARRVIKVVDHYIKISYSRADKEGVMPVLRVVENVVGSRFNGKYFAGVAGQEEGRAGPVLVDDVENALIMSEEDCFAALIDWSAWHTFVILEWPKEDPDEKITQRLADMVWQPLDVVSKWLNGMGYETTYRGEHSMGFYNTHRKIYSIIDIEDDPNTRAMSLAFLLAGMECTKVYPRLQMIVNREWKRRTNKA